MNRTSARKSAACKAVFLFDVDNTLLSNDQVIADLEKYLEAGVGARGARDYWKFFEELREELGYADYLGALQRYRASFPHDLRLLAVSRATRPTCGPVSARANQASKPASSMKGSTQGR